MLKNSISCYCIGILPNELVVSSKAESNSVGCAAATSRKAREVAHPQLFRSMLNDKPACPVKVTHRTVLHHERSDFGSDFYSSSLAISSFESNSSSSLIDSPAAAGMCRRRA